MVFCFSSNPFHFFLKLNLCWSVGENSCFSLSVALFGFSGSSFSKWPYLFWCDSTWVVVSAESLDEDVWPSKVVICLVELSETEATTPLHLTSSWLLGWGDTYLL
ncbi:hypothetical protein EB796_021399 [Bugula neritina]|uniref:Uncharacterized protein n=1 Tax=Bugula neritina TaxID=10212 RepID=A0A7J7J2I1_BUGNE|nr:hypothetical protein EB796_021399 [Bugula neritina]